MGAGTSSGKSVPAWEKEIDNASFSSSGKTRTFSIPGIGGAAVEATPDTTTKTMRYTAYVWTPNTAATPINGGQTYATRDEANSAAKKVLKNRRRVELKSGG